MAMLGACDVRLGGQGWSEPDWVGVFYPRGLKAGDRLTCYARVFDFVEIDSTFYAVPPPHTVQAWVERTPEHFRFTAKLPQAITHDPDPTTHQPRQPLAANGWQEHLAYFLDTMQPLSAKLLAVLVQLPPQWHWRPERLDVLARFLKALPTEPRWAIEFRHRG